MHLKVVPSDPDPFGKDEAEISVIASVFLEPERAPEALALLSPGDFEHRPHNLIWRAIKLIQARGALADPLAVANELRTRQELDAAGGRPYLAEIVEVVPTSANLPFWAGIVRDRAIRRRVEAKLQDGAPLAGVRALLDEAITEDQALPQAIPAIEVIDSPPEFHVQDLIPDREVSLVFGRSGSMKSALLLELAGATAAGDDFLQHFGCRGGSVVYATAEDPPPVLKNRLEALCRGRGWDPADVLARIHVLDCRGWRVEESAFQAQVIQEAQRVEARLAIFDPLIFLTTANENDNAAMRPVMGFFNRLTRELAAPVIVAHHEGKPHEERRKAADRLRGASVILSSARAALHLVLADDGHLTVTNVKQSRTQLYPAFAVDVEIETAYDNEAAWYSASLTRSSIAVITIEAEAAITAVLAEHGTLNSNELKAKVAARGVDVRDVLPARKRMEAAGRIGHTPGARNSMNWYLEHDRASPETPGQKTTEPTGRMPGPRAREWGGGIY
ncbi:MAG TPA: AAA family ATPase [Longimicrobiaceae bacterium]|nr:AAA family ATPase [Longimicrobiaceae bacterium]